MKKLLSTCAIAAIFLGLCSNVIASPTLPQTGSSQPESQNSVSYIKDSKESNFFLEGWLYWLLDDIFGWDPHGSWHYNSGSSSVDSGSDSGGVDWDSGSGGIDWGSGGSDSGSGSGDGDSGSGSGDSDWDSGSGSGDGDSGSGSGDSGWDSGSGSGDSGWDTGTGDGDWGSGVDNGGWDSGSGGGGWGYDDTNSNPAQSIPAPGALVLGSIGMGIISWLRRRRTL